MRVLLFLLSPPQGDSTEENIFFYCIYMKSHPPSWIVCVALKLHFSCDHLQGSVPSLQPLLCVPKFQIGCPCSKTHRGTPTPNPSPSRLSLILSSPVLGPLQAFPDASQAPARPCLPAARAPAPDPPLHPGASPLPGRALDPQVHSGCHHLPSHGKVTTGTPPWPALSGAPPSHLSLAFSWGT